MVTMCQWLYDPYTQINFLNPYILNSLWDRDCYQSHFAEEETESEKLTILPRVTELVHGGAGIQILAAWSQSPHISPLLLLMKQSDQSQDPSVCHHAQGSSTPKIIPLLIPNALLANAQTLLFLGHIS